MQKIDLLAAWYLVIFLGLLPALSRWREGASTSGTLSLAGNFTAAWWVAVAISVLAFVLGHPGQGLMRSAFLVAFSLGCHALTRTTGSLLPAIASHFLYDLGAGVAAIRFARLFDSSA
jgi:membrane protease YdiL (CAAX protease family)